MEAGLRAGRSGPARYVFSAERRKSPSHYRRLLPGAKSLHGPLGGLDGLGIVAEENLGRLAPTVTNLYGVGYDPCLAARLAGFGCGLSRRRSHDHANANR